MKASQSYSCSLCVSTWAEQILWIFQCCSKDVNVNYRWRINKNFTTSIVYHKIILKAEKNCQDLLVLELHGTCRSHSDCIDKWMNAAHVFTHVCGHAVFCRPPANKRTTWGRNTLTGFHAFRFHYRLMTQSKAHACYCCHNATVTHAQMGITLFRMMTLFSSYVWMFLLFTIASHLKCLGMYYITASEDEWG